MLGDTTGVLDGVFDLSINAIDNKPPHGGGNALTHEEPPTIKEVMLTTSDNPFDPFDNFLLWYRFDLSKNYNSAGYLARIAKTSDELSDADNALEIERAVDEIVQLNLLGIYKKVQRIVPV